MSKKLRREPIYIAPEIVGQMDENYEPVVFNERTRKKLTLETFTTKLIFMKDKLKVGF